MEENLIEKPDLVKYEDEHDILLLKPTGWEVILTEKDTGSVFDFGQYIDKEEARKVFDEELKNMKSDEDVTEEEIDAKYEEVDSDEEKEEEIEDEEV